MHGAHWTYASAHSCTQRGSCRHLRSWIITGLMPVASTPPATSLVSCQSNNSILGMATTEVTHPTLVPTVELEARNLATAIMSGTAPKTLSYHKCAHWQHKGPSGQSASPSITGMYTQGFSHKLDRTGHRDTSSKPSSSVQTLPGAVRPRPFQGYRAKTKALIAEVTHGRRKQGMAKVIQTKSQCFQGQHPFQGLQGQNLQG